MGDRELKKENTITLKLPSERKEDVFDKDDFDATKFINQMYPDEASLTDIDRFAGVLKKQVQRHNQEYRYQPCNACMHPLQTEKHPPCGMCHADTSSDMTPMHADPGH